MPTNSRNSRAARTPNPPKGGSKKPARPSAKRPRNLSLSSEAIARGEAYSAARGTTLSAVVEQFLRALPAPVELDDESLAPAARRQLEIEYARANSTSRVVRALAGLLAESDLGEGDPREVYREHLWRKHGRR